MGWLEYDQFPFLLGQFGAYFQGLCESRKKPSYLPLYWLFNRDLYNGLLQSPHNWVGFHPLYTLNNHNACFSLVILVPSVNLPSLSSAHSL